MRTELVFESREAFRNWLEENVERKDGVWLLLGKSSHFKTLTAHEALEEALCFGWIDSTIIAVDEHKYRKYFSPRRKGSNWSEKNKKLVAKLVDQGLMTPHGLAAIECARQSGEWDRNRLRGVSAEQVDGFERLIRASEIAYANFMALAPSYRRNFVGFYYDAKSDEARSRRLAKIIDLLEQNKRLM